MRTAAINTGKRFKNNILNILPVLRWIFYIFFVFLWFKDNIPPLRTLRLSYWIPLLPLLGILIFQGVVRLKQKKIGRLPRFSKISLILLLILLAGLAIRIPFLLNSYGLGNSDDAIMGLMGKHISEGKVPPICFYGQLYMGSLSAHFFALMFKLFGYSIFILKFSSVLFFLGFITVHFFFLREVFSDNFALVISFFCCLPIGQLIRVSFDATSAYPLVLLLGTALLYLSYQISYKKKDHLIPCLGFLMGLTFWTHQITISCILTCFIILLVKAKFSLKKYITLLFFVLVGGLPLLMQEIYEKFQILKFLRPRKVEYIIINANKLARTAKYTAALLSKEGSWLSYVLLLAVAMGFLYLVWSSFKKRTFLPSLIYSFYFILFYLLYLPSEFSNVGAVRYFYPLYICLPVLLLVTFLALKSRLKYLYSFGFVSLLFLFFNLKAVYPLYVDTRDYHRNLSRVVIAMQETGKRSWLGDYWTSYLITAISKEKIIVDCYNIERYLPYRLGYYNQNDKENFVFLRSPGSRERKRANYLIKLLRFCGVGFRMKVVGDCRLIYDIDSAVRPRLLSALGAFRRVLPSQVPELRLNRIQCSEGFLRCSFVNKNTADGSEFRLHVKIPGYSERSVRLPMSAQEVRVQIPFPLEESFIVSYYIDYAGFKISASAKQVTYTPPQGVFKRKESVTYLLGFGPETQFFGKRMKPCEKEAKLEIQNLPKEKLLLTFSLYSPFKFSQIYWYGQYTQEVQISISGGPSTAKVLKYGNNVVVLPVDGKSLKSKNELITLCFKYHFPFTFDADRKTSALLDNLKIEKVPLGRPAAPRY